MKIFKSLILLTFLGIFNSCSGQDSPESLVLIPEGKCSGFIYKTNLVITAAHCIQPELETRDILVVFKGLKLQQLFKVKKLDRNSDIAVLQGNTLNFTPVKGVSKYSPAIYTEVTSFGYPLEFITPFYYVHLFEGLHYVKRLNSLYYMFTNPISVGCSGSPVFNKKGEVIAMIAIKYDAYTGGVPNFILYDFLKEF